MAEGGEVDKDQKTEEPSERRLQKAREDGDFAKSQELPLAFGLLGVTLIVLTISSVSTRALLPDLTGLLANAHDIDTGGPGLTGLGASLLTTFTLALAAPVAVMLLLGFAGHLVQHGITFSAKKVQPDLAKLSPIAGFGRLFGMQNLISFLKNLAKLSVVGGVVIAVLWHERHGLEAVLSLDPVQLLPHTRDLAALLLFAVLGAVLVIAVADYAYQRFSWWQKHKMTPKEVKDEHKETEGDPHIKGRLRQLRAARARKRMMARVPEASVVVTNPTHYAVALKYEHGMAAPVCIAKGLDRVALRIRELADAAGVPIVENPPLARSLYASVDLDVAIPPEHYKAVAEIIGYVMRLRRRAARDW